MDQVNTQFPETPVIEKLFKGSEVARLLNVSRSFAYLIMQSGELPTVRLGRSVRVRPSDLRNYIMKNTVGETVNELVRYSGNHDGSNSNNAE
jgi:excisionase family DNA binding protein